MIHKLILRNFKKIKEETFLLNNFDLIVGANNSGKSTILQALYIWQYCVNQFNIANKTRGGRGIQVILPDFTALPLPEFNLLWTDRISKSGNRENQNIFIEIDVYWKNAVGDEQNLCVQMYYQSPQAVYASPKKGWADFRKFRDDPNFPIIVYVPPFSALETEEAWKDDGNVRQSVGKAQPGAVLRNLLYRVIDRVDVEPKNNADWKKINEKINEWFGVELLLPKYEKGISTKIISEYKAETNKKTFDIISGGSGFHQILTLLAFMYGYKDTTTILFDEPDAHLHVNLQRQILNYIRQHTRVQFLIATHSEEFIKNVEVSSILSILSGKPERIQASSSIITAMSEVDNIDVIRTQDSPYILYVEGEDDERILSAWANTLDKTEIYQKFYPYVLGGGTKTEMKNKANNHYQALKQIVPELKRAIILDYDTNDTAFHPTEQDQPVLNEWKRKNIDNYLFVPDAWKRAVGNEVNYEMDSLLYNQVIDNAFAEENLSLPLNKTWKNVKAQVFSTIDGKKLLFENRDSLFNRIKDLNDLQLKINRLAVATAMTREEIHEDVEKFFDNLTKIISQP
jgi:predicted ATPase